MTAGELLGRRTTFMLQGKFGNTKCHSKDMITQQTYLGDLIGLFSPRVTLLTLASKLAKCGNICNLLAACAKAPHAQDLNSFPRLCTMPCSNAKAIAFAALQADSALIASESSQRPNKATNWRLIEQGKQQFFAAQPWPPCCCQHTEPSLLVSHQVRNGLSQNSTGQVEL